MALHFSAHSAADLSAIAYPDRGSSPSQSSRLLVMLHGWGADARDLADLAPMLDLPNCQWRFVNAPFAHPQIPGGRAWYDLESQTFEGLSQAKQSLRAYLLGLEAKTGIPLARTVLGGFSQGGAMALDVGLTLPLAKIFSLSGYLHFQPEPQLQAIAPILLIHGTEDPVVPVRMAQQAKAELEGIGATVEYQEFPMGHAIPPMALARLKSFLS
ncbi:alpha/beta hydrolase [Synechocystis sp. PCC 7339]|uniref:alpha/beta hydrolase n=1 Tax=unclassified Synechocystis TaxID=2640012 RepID=UPI001BB0216D|nr:MULTISPECIES: alpha/beta hydrolase [unclassified Synechocystis]QUS59530.1 alpha/beta hydrolase [Synechocystis sp. PCC 7338]UAJ71715.1 alpha/beta hydrolase [Synechocystis sp. PCC 7339]